MQENPLLKKLHYKGQNPVLILSAPEELASFIQSIPAEVHTKAQIKYDFVQIFAITKNEAESLSAIAIKHLRDDGLLWITYPKKTSKKYKAEVSRDYGWTTMAQNNFEPVSLVAITDDWSALRFRSADRITSFKRKSAISEAGKKRGITKLVSSKSKNHE